MKILKFAASPLLSVVGGLLKPKVPKQSSGPGPVTRDDARAAIDLEDDWRRRRGGAADIVTGAMGAEAPAGSRQVLG